MREGERGSWEDDRERVTITGQAGKRDVWEKGETEEKRESKEREKKSKERERDSKERESKEREKDTEGDRRWRGRG